MNGPSNDWSDPYLLLNQSVGSLLYLWCRLDDALSDALQEQTGEPQSKAKKSFHDRLARLEPISDADIGNNPTLASGLPDLVARLNQARRTRNLIVHSLRGFNADRLRGEPHITCIAEEGSVQITQNELSALLEDMARCWQQLESFAIHRRLQRRTRRS